MKRFLCSFFLLAVIVVVATTPTRAQETRAMLMGRVTDATGGVVPGVAINATNVETNVTTPSITNDEGLFRIPFLMPGQYEVKAELAGFKTSVRKGITLNVNAEVSLDIKLEVGEMSQSVTVTAEEPVLNTTSASVGEVIDNKRVMELPILGNSAMLMTSLAMGMQRTEGYNYLGLHSTVGASGYETSGGVGGHEWTLDGTPNSGHSRRAAYLPYSDAIDELRVESTTFDAKVGHTTGASITMMSKAGTNQYHGTLTENHWQTRWNATANNDNGAYWKKIYDAEKAGNTALANELRKQPRQPSGRSNNYAASIGGPVKIPWLFDGTDKLFFFFIFNGFKDAKTEEPGSKLHTMPTEKHRQGDFSDLLAVNPAKYQIYDPLTTTFKNGVYERQPFPNNIIPASRIINPMYKFYEKWYPLPNHPPNEDAETRNNYFNGNIPMNWDYKAFQNRIDYVHSEKNKFFGRWSWNKFMEDRGDWTMDTHRYMHSNGMIRLNKGAGLDWVHTFTPTDVLHVATAYNRYVDNNINREQLKYKPSDVGLPKYMDEKAGEYHHLPRLDFDNAYPDFSGNYGILNPISTATLTADYSKYMGKHSLAFGWDGRNYYRVQRGPGNTSGYFEFRRNLLMQKNTSTGVGDIGLQWAAFMLGIPSAMSVDTNDTRYQTTPYHGVFVQDNFRLSPKLTLNLGVRMEYEGSIRERFDRGLRAWDFNYKLPQNIVDAMKAGYQAVAIPERSVDSLVAGIVGGAEYLGVNGAPRTMTNPTWRLMPRFGFAYKFADKMVIRGGYGVYYDTLNVSYTEIDQSGFNRGTGATITTDNGVTWGTAPATWDPKNGVSPVSDPFPVRADGTRFNVPYGNKLGPLAYFGRGRSFINGDYEPAEQQRWRVEIERQVLGNSVISIAYAGSYVDNLSMTGRTDSLRVNLNAVPKEYWIQGNARDQAKYDALVKSISNPFKLANFAFLQTENPLLYQQMSTLGFFTGSTRQKQVFLRPYPHVDGDLNIDRLPIGKNKYHAMQARFEKRFSDGWSLSTHYEFSHTMSKDWVANSYDTEPTWRESDSSRPHRWVATSIYELPFGAGKWLMNRNDWLNAAFGGWQLGVVWQFQSGECIDFGNLFYYGNSYRDILLPASQQTKDRWFNNGWDYPTGDPRNIDPATGKPFPNKLWQTDSSKTATGYHARVFPNRFNFLRTDKVKQLDANIQKAFNIREGLRALFRVDLLNAPNYQVMGGPGTDPTAANFGKISGYNNTPRFIQFQLRIVY